MQVRKYKIAELLSNYDEATQKALKETMCAKMGIGRQMLHAYINALDGDERAPQLSDKKKEVIAQMFGIYPMQLLASEHDIEQLKGVKI